MSFKAKDLHYEKQEPAFLRRLKGHYDSADGRSNVQIARPKKDRLKTGDGEDDEPLIVDENGEVVGKSDFENMQKDPRRPDSEAATTSVDAGPADESDMRADDASHRDKQQVLGLGGPKKRKQAKAVGGESDDNDDSKEKVDKPKAPTSNSSSKANDGAKAKKKVKKIKLSFDEPE